MITVTDNRAIQIKKVKHFCLSCYILLHPLKKHHLPIQSETLAHFSAPKHLLFSPITLTLTMFTVSVLLRNLHQF